MSPGDSTHALVVLSSRLPFTLRHARGATQVERSPGGRVAALEPVLARRGGARVGWPGGTLPAGFAMPEVPGYRLLPVPGSKSEVRRFYHGFANGTLWPLLHSLPTRMELDRETWSAYEEANARFARVALAETGERQAFWIHDSQLMRVAPHLR